MIAERLSAELARSEDLIAALGAWMGLPWEEGYEERAGQYRQLEQAVLSEILERLGEGGGGGCSVVDTAGSVIYAGRDLLEGLAARTVLVHLEAPPEVRARLLEGYLERPGPVLWPRRFRPGPGGAVRDVIARCYERLLDDREQRYTRWARVSLPYEVHRQGGLDADGFLDRVRAASRV